jgi:ABC-type taurine transport system ATPase subunit
VRVCLFNFNPIFLAGKTTLLNLIAGRIPTRCLTTAQSPATASPASQHGTKVGTIYVA